MKFFKHKSTIFILSLLFLLMAAACGQRESEAFVQKKLDLRQRIDEAVLNIDESLENVHRRLAAAQTREDSTQVVKLSSYVDDLESVRGSLNHKLDEVADVKQGGWQNFKSQTEDTLAEVRATIELVQVDPPTDINVPY
jgi:hypothetical protein